MFHWLHHLINPHCPECKADKQEDAICQTCEVLTVQLARSNVEKDQLLNQIERMANPPVITEPTEQEIPQPIMPRVVPWAVKRAMLEAEDRHKAKLTREAIENDKTNQTNIDDLEREVGITDG